MLGARRHVESSLFTSHVSRLASHIWQMIVTLNELSPAERQRWLNPLIAPRPIAFVSTIGADGLGNLAPFSYFAMGGDNPQSVAFCPIADRDGNPKDTLRNVKATGECTINIVSRAMAEGVNAASATFPYGVDEFDQVPFTREPSQLVKPPRVAESPAAMECRVFQIVPHGSGPLHATWVICEVLLLRVKDEVIAGDGYPDTALVHPAARMGRNEWAHVTPEVTFKLERPTMPPGMEGMPAPRRTLGQ